MNRLRFPNANANRAARAFLRGRVIGQMDLGSSATEIAGRLNLSVRTVQRWIRQFRVTGSILPQKPGGSVKKTTPRADRLLIRLAKRHRLSSAREVLQMWQERVSVQTVYRRWLTKRLRRYRLVKRPMLSAQQKLNRYQWANARVLWRAIMWNRIVWTDESRIRLHSNDGRSRVTRERGERFRDDCIAKTVTAGGGSVHIWAGIWHDGRSEIQVLQGNVTGNSYINVLQHFLNNNINDKPENWILQDDNAPPHRAQVVNRFKQEAGIRSIPWPARSPDLNPIEHVWDYLKRRLNAGPFIPNLANLTIRIREEWANMPQNFVQNLINSMNRRIQAVILANGGYTRY